MAFSVIWALSIYYLDSLYTEPGVVSLTKSCPILQTVSPHLSTLNMLN